MLASQACTSYGTQYSVGLTDKEGLLSSAQTCEKLPTRDPQGTVFV